MPKDNEIVSLILAFATVGAVALSAAAVLWLTGSARRLLPPQRWRSVPWNGPLCGAACLVLIVVPNIVNGALAQSLDSAWLATNAIGAETARHVVPLISGLVALPVVLVLWWAIFRGACDARLEQFGVTAWQARSRAVLGVVAWLLYCPVVYLANLAALVVYGLLHGAAPAEHPLLNLLRSEGAANAIAVLILAESVVAAPIREEVLFRGILQPWLTRHPQGGVFGFIWAAMIGVVRRSLALDQVTSGGWAVLASPVVLVLAVAPAAWYLAGLVGRREPPPMLRWFIPLVNPEQRRQAVLGLFGTAVLFANLHAAVWPTPIPLFVLGLGLGWLALRTQSLVAPVVVHALFNAVACLDMFYQR